MASDNAVTTGNAGDVAIVAPAVRVLTAEDILALPDLVKNPHVVAVPIPELGDGAAVYVREMSSAERDRFDESIATEDGRTPDNFRAKFVAATCCDEKGKLLFISPQVTALGGKSPAVVHRIFRESRKLNPPLNELVANEKKDSESGS